MGKRMTLNILSRFPYLLFSFFRIPPMWPIHFSWSLTLPRIYQFNELYLHFLYLLSCWYWIYRSCEQLIWCTLHDRKSMINHREFAVISICAFWIFCFLLFLYSKLYIYAVQLIDLQTVNKRIETDILVIFVWTVSLISLFCLTDERISLFSTLFSFP